VPWSAILWFGVLLISAFGPTLWRLVGDWARDEDMGHGFFVPAVAAYIAWQRRQELLSLPRSHNPLGLAVMIWGALQLYAATLGAELFLARTAFIVSLTGLLLYQCGSRCTKILALPLFLLCFMVPIPAIIYNQITFPLQLFASQVAETVLSLLGIPVFREGNILELPSQRLSVVEACSGIRSLLSLSFLSLVYAHFFDRRGWMKPYLLVATIPIAVAANAGRVTLTGLLSEWSPELAKGFFHSVEGWVVFMAALFLLIGFHRLTCGLTALVSTARRAQPTKEPPGDPRD
jgi:exosortase